MRLLIIFLLFTVVRAQQQYPCSCSCCNGASCIPNVLSTVYALSCTTEACLVQCRASYPTICQATPPYGQIIAQCTSSIAQQYSCQCNCCNTGSASCSPSYVGTSVAYTCASGSCSISCAQQYPSQCISNQNGQTQGLCMGPITTTTTTTTVGPWLGNTCSCMCCQSGSSCTPTYVGITSASQCLSTACNQACQIRYPSVCPSLYILGQTIGTCTSSTTSGTTQCACNCCGTTGCFNYTIRTNEGCTACNSLCQSQSQSQCPNTFQVTHTCSLNNAKTFHPWIIFILSIIFFNFFVITDFI
ncbi:unnamed protein product [Adineta steineri]|uniref:Uncharacterized protein n=1 Tax=Adineta steineri TaxID=433720 RepID=A0A814X0C8_9BILA|nr:unnamed protein product [Adineta steineri]